jgi:hypothetical protein
MSSVMFRRAGYFHTADTFIVSMIWVYMYELEWLAQGVSFEILDQLGGIASGLILALPRLCSPESRKFRSCSLSVLVMVLMMVVNKVGDRGSIPGCLLRPAGQ